LPNWKSGDVPKIVDFRRKHNVNQTEPTQNRKPTNARQEQQRRGSDPSLRLIGRREDVRQANGQSLPTATLLVRWPPLCAIPRGRIRGLASSENLRLG
jgi:hypothetical protein